MGIFLVQGNRHIGNIKLGPINLRHKVADLGFLIGERREWGKGYATQAIQLLCNYGFVQLGLDKITAGAYQENIGSQKALIKSGFKKEGCQQSQWTWNGVRQDGILFGRVKKKSKK